MPVSDTCGFTCRAMCSVGAGSIPPSTDLPPVRVQHVVEGVAQEVE